MKKSLRKIKKPINKNYIVINGKSLKSEDIYNIVNNPKIKVRVSENAIKKVIRSKQFLNKKMEDTVIYGVTTGFGPMATHIIGKDQVKELQYNLIRSHAVGIGDPIPKRFALASMIVRLNTLANGYSGVSENLIKQLVLFINNRIIPVIPEHGAVGASGDLVQLAHIAITLIGEGEVFYKDKIMKTSAVLKRLKIKPHVLRPKEGLALINGTSTMTGIAALLIIDTERLINLAIRSSVLALELVKGISDTLFKELHSLRPHEGQQKIAKVMRHLLSSSKLLNNRKEIEARVNIIDNVYVTQESIQNVYSFRCVAQILGPVLDIYNKVKKDIDIEINSVTDNPIILVRKKLFLHGGNFHGDYIATAMDQLKIGIVKMTMLSERRINFFLNENINKMFPPFINLNQPGLTLSLQGLQFVATSTTAQSQSLAYPHSIHSISTNADNQDVVSMGTDAALMTSKTIENAYSVLAIELVTLAQAVDYLKVTSKLSPSSKLLYKKTRKVVSKIISDRSLTKEISIFIDKIKIEHDFDLDIK